MTTSPNLSFEPATSADAEMLVRVQTDSFNSDSLTYPGIEPGGPSGYDKIESVLEQIRDDLVHKIVYDGKIVGGIVVEDLGQGHFHLDRLYIDPAYHNLGIGSRAMNFIEREYPARLWTLNTPTYATRNQHFYEKFGYIRTGEFPEPDHPDIVLIDYEKHMS